MANSCAKVLIAICIGVASSTRETTEGPEYDVPPSVAPSVPCRATRRATHRTTRRQGTARSRVRARFLQSEQSCTALADPSCCCS